jgi:hypothetical protein
VAGVSSFWQGDVIIHSSSKEDAIYFSPHFKSCQRNWKRNYMKQENRRAIPFMANAALERGADTFLISNNSIQVLFIQYPVWAC